MAYDANIDYRARQNQYKEQMKQTTDPNELARLQGLWDTDELARANKLASNLGKFGRYASESELDTAAGIRAEQQIGTGFETQKQNLNKAYEQAKRSLGQSALSRGMARSSYVQDREAGLGTELATSLSNVDAERAAAIQSAKANIIDKFQADEERRIGQEKQSFIDTIGAHYADFQAEIDRIRNQEDRSEDWKIPYLNAERERKLKEIEQRELQQAALNAQYGDYSGLGLSDTAGQYAEGIFQYQHPYLFGGGGYGVGRGYSGGTGTGATGTTTGGGVFGGATGDKAIRADAFNMLAGGATSKEILESARQQYGANSQTYKEYEHAINIAGGAARRR